MRTTARQHAMCKSTHGRELRYHRSLAAISCLRVHVSIYVRLHSRPHVENMRMPSACTHTCFAVAYQFDLIVCEGRPNIPQCHADLHSSACAVFCLAIAFYYSSRSQHASVSIVREHHIRKSVDYAARAALTFNVVINVETRLCTATTARASCACCHSHQLIRMATQRARMLKYSTQSL